MKHSAGQTMQEMSISLSDAQNKLNIPLNVETKCVPCMFSRILLQIAFWKKAIYDNIRHIETI